MRRIKLRVEARRIFLDQRLEPALRGRAIENMVRLFGKRAAVQIELMQKTFKRRFGSGFEPMTRIASAKRNPFRRKPGKFKSAKAKSHVMSSRHHARGKV